MSTVAAPTKTKAPATPVVRDARLGGLLEPVIIGQLYVTDGCGNPGDLVLVLQGSLDRYTAPILFLRAKGYLTPRATLLLDLRSASLDVSGVPVLAALKKEAGRCGAEIGIADIGTKSREILHSAGLEHLADRSSGDT